jgi:hypothetical protein
MQIEINYEAQFSINPVFKDKIEKNKLKKYKKNNSSQLRLTSQTRNLSHEKEDNLIIKTETNHKV